MDIRAFKLIAIELIHGIKIKTIPFTKDDIWICEPTFEIGFNNSNEIVQNIEYAIIREQNSKQATIKTRTSFMLWLGTKEYKPITENDFEFYTLISQVSLAHTRAMFLREARGTYFDGDLI